MGAGWDATRYRLNAKSIAYVALVVKASCPHNRLSYYGAFSVILSNRRRRDAVMTHMTKAVILNEVKDLPPRVQIRLSRRAMSLVATDGAGAPLYPI
jgi:hypothetical protein